MTENPQENPGDEDDAPPPGMLGAHGCWDGEEPPDLTNAFLHKRDPAAPRPAQEKTPGNAETRQKNFECGGNDPARPDTAPRL